MLPSEVPRLATDLPVRVFPGVWKPLFFKTPFLGQISIPTSFISLFIFYILSYLLSNTMDCLSGCLMSSAGIQKLFCGICSAFKCSFDECVGEKVISTSCSSAILGPPPTSLVKIIPKYFIILYYCDWDSFITFLIFCCYVETTGFCTLILHPATWLNPWISLTGFLVESEMFDV